MCPSVHLCYYPPLSAGALIMLTAHETVWYLRSACAVPQPRLQTAGEVESIHLHLLAVAMQRLAFTPDPLKLASSTRTTPTPQSEPSNRPCCLNVIVSLSNQSNVSLCHCQIISMLSSSHCLISLSVREQGNQQCVPISDSVIIVTVRP